jgi:NAD(P)-dependent dehydrogenase (short-subunit alcohol dehydrogenase family)
MEEIEWQLGINLWGVIYGTKAFLPLMLKQGEGHIVNLSSIFGLIGFYGQAAYNISKFGVRGLTECLWWELEDTGVKATTVHPGGIKTNIGTKARFGKHASQRVLDLEHKFGELLLTPPEECARTILDGVAKGKKRIVTGHKSTLVDRLARLFPASYHALVKRDIKI